MKKYFVLSILLMLSVNLFLWGQENKIYEPFQFENFTPKWQHAVIDTSLAGVFKQINPYNGDSIFYDGFSQFYGIDILQVDPVFYDDKVFLIEQFGFVLNSEGAFIQCLNRNSGDLIWETGYDLRNISQREYPSYAFINKEGQLEILGYREDKTYDQYPQFYWKYAKMTIRKYDTNTGELVGWILTDEEDKQTAELWPTTPLLSVGVKSEIYPYGDNEYQYLELSDTLKSIVLDSISHIADTIINRRLLHKYVSTIQFKMFRTLKNENIVFMYDAPISTFNFADSSEMYLMKIDNNNNVLVEKEIKQILKPTDYVSWTYNIFSNDDHITFVGEEHVDVGDSTVPLMFYSVFDSDANHIEEILLRDENGDPYFYGDYGARVGLVLKLKYEPGILIFASELSSDGFNYINIFKTDGNGNYVRVKHLKISGKNHSLGLTGGYFTPEGDVVLKVLDINSDFENYTNSSTFATVYILFSAEDLDIKTDVEENPVYYKMRVFPNPVEDAFIIELEDNINGKIEIFDVLANKMMTSNINNEKSITLDISGFSKGVYFVKLFVDGQTLSIAKVIKY